MSTWVQRNLEHQDVHRYGLFSVILKSEDLLIGDCGLEHMEVDGALITELGYDFNRNYWNQGYATEAGQAVRDYAFDVLHIPELISLIRVGNEASRRVSEKIGMQCETEFTTNNIKYWKYAMNGRTDEKKLSALIALIPSFRLPYCRVLCSRPGSQSAYQRYLNGGHNGNSIFKMDHD